jgi:hypothetical protein
VSEPIDTEADCEDIGFAYADINEIIKDKHNYVNKQLECKYGF